MKHGSELINSDSIVGNVFTGGWVTSSSMYGSLDTCLIQLCSCW